MASERERNQSEYISVTSTHTRAPPQTVPLTLDLTPLPHLPAAAAATQVLCTFSFSPPIKVEYVIPMENHQSLDEVRDNCDASLMTRGPNSRSHDTALVQTFCLFLWGRNIFHNVSSHVKSDDKDWSSLSLSLPPSLSFAHSLVERVSTRARGSEKYYE